MASFIWPPQSGNSGTVTSVGFSDGSTTPIFSISGSPVTSSGTITETLVTQSANTVFAGPTSGGSAQPAFRALVAGDLPSGTGTVTSVSVVSANGLAGTVANATTTPAITLSTSITGILQGNGTAISAATTGNLTDAGTDGITVTGGTGAVLGSGTSLSQHVADTTHNGYLSSADWNTFNGKQAAFSGLTTDGMIYATSGTAVASTSAGSQYQPMVSNGGSGSAPTFQPLPLNQSAAITGTLPVGNGGTGQASNLTQYGVVYGSTTTAMATTSAGTASYPLVANSGAAPTFQQLSLTAGVTGTLPVGNGGTGQASSLNAGGVVVANSTSAMTSTSAGSQYQPLVANSSGNPSFQALNLAQSAAVTGVLPVGNSTPATSAIGTVTTTATVTWSNSNVFTMTLTNSDTCVVTFSGAASGQTIQVIVTQPSSGGGTGVITWPTTYWAGGTIPTMTTGNSAIDVYTFTYSGSIYVANAVQNMAT